MLSKCILMPKRCQSRALFHWQLYERHPFCFGREEPDMTAECVFLWPLIVVVSGCIDKQLIVPSGWQTGCQPVCVCLCTINNMYVCMSVYLSVCKCTQHKTHRIYLPVSGVYWLVVSVWLPTSPRHRGRVAPRGGEGWGPLMSDSHNPLSKRLCSHTNHPPRHNWAIQL